MSRSIAAVRTLAFLSWLACVDHPTGPARRDEPSGPSSAPPELAPSAIQSLLEDPLIRALVESAAGPTVADELAVILGRLTPSRQMAEVHAAIAALSALRSAQDVAAAAAADTSLAVEIDPMTQLIQDALDLVIDHTLATLAADRVLDLATTFPAQESDRVP